MNYYAIIPAAGAGRRFGGAKQFLTLKGKTLVDWTVEAFLATSLFSKIVVCLPNETPLRGEGRGEGEGIIYAPGGSTRAESVYKGFAALNPNENDFVLIHDAARPLVSVALIQRVHEALKKHAAAIPVLSLTDTVKRIQNGKVLETLDRSTLAAAQTPQGFSCGLLARVYKEFLLEEEPLKKVQMQGAREPARRRTFDGTSTKRVNRATQQMGLFERFQKYTDEAMMVEALGETVHTVAGEKANIKITVPEDLQAAEWILKNIGDRKF